MRGPFGSLIAQLSRTNLKSASPIAFCRAVAHPRYCMLVASFCRCISIRTGTINYMATKDLSDRKPAQNG